MSNLLPRLFPGECEGRGQHSPPPECCSVLMALILSGDCVSQVLGRSSSQCRLSNSFSCKYLKLNLLYTCIVIATFP